jgi:hypothetical protein
MELEEANMTCGNRDGRTSSGLVAGVVIIAAGVILLLDRFGVLNVEEIWRYWPLLLVAGGAAKAVQASGPGRLAGILALIFGIILSINAFGFVHINIWDLWWPVLLIGFGSHLLWRALQPDQPGQPKPERRWRAADGVRLSAWSIFGGGERRLGAGFQGGEVLALFGGWNIDLTQAEMTEDEVVIEANCMFGGIVVRVPGTWEVKVRGVGIFGGYGDRTRHPRPDEVLHPKRLIVRGVALFGGVDVKN